MEDEYLTDGRTLIFNAEVLRCTSLPPRAYVAALPEGEHCFPLLLSCGALLQPDEV